MIITERITIRANNNIKYYRNKNYVVVDGVTPFDVLVSDLPKNSNHKIDCQCDNCDNTANISLFHYNKNFEKYSIYTCKKCSFLKNKKTNMERYGVESPLQNKEILEKVKKTNNERYGSENPMQNIDIQNKKKVTNNEKYGSDCVLQNEDIKQKIKVTNNKKYGSDYGLGNKDVINKRIDTLNKQHIEKNSMVLSNDYDIIEYKEMIFNISHKVCGNIFIINNGNFNERLKNNLCLCTVCYPIGDNKSIKEKEIINWLKDLYIDLIESDKTILRPKHLDIYLPNHNIAIEFNGLFWHGENKVDKNYHLNKSLMCQDKGIHLMHIWEDEWIFKQDIVKSIIKNKLNVIENKIFARNCVLKEVTDSKLVRKFLDDNHIQGYSQSSIKLGLYYNSELVSLMTFGYRHTNSKKEFELIRFCNILNTNVIGASSKLFKYYLNNYLENDILSYSDFRLFDGKMYETLGFQKIHLSKPDYFWTKNLERKHRFTFNKQKLIKDGYDPNKTEVEIMHDRGYQRIWSCGQVRWEFKR